MKEFPEAIAIHEEMEEKSRLISLVNSDFYAKIILSYFFPFLAVSECRQIKKMANIKYKEIEYLIFVRK